jgi:hypothetical protein
MATINTCHYKRDVLVKTLYIKMLYMQYDYQWHLIYFVRIVPKSLMLNGKLIIDFTFFQVRPPRLIGVDISLSLVKMVELSVAGKNSSAYRVERYAIQPLPKDPELDGNIVNLGAVSESLRCGWKRMGRQDLRRLPY